jgi:acetyl esterase/lipase
MAFCKGTTLRATLAWARCPSYLRALALVSQPPAPAAEPDYLLELAAAYLKGADPRTPLASPIHADLRGLPPMLIQVGSAETLLDDAVRLARVAGTADVRVTLEIWPDMIHAFPLFYQQVAAGRRAGGGWRVRPVNAGLIGITVPVHSIDLREVHCFAHAERAVAHPGQRHERPHRQRRALDSRSSRRCIGASSLKG